MAGFRFGPHLQSVFQTGQESMLSDILNRHRGAFESKGLIKSFTWPKCR